MNHKEKGYAAFFAGIAKTACPFPVGSEARWRWFRGWEEAKKERAAKATGGT